VARIRVSTLIDAPRDEVWATVRDIERHVSWMEDAVAIRFTSDRRSGLGTTFDCDTRVGPIRLTDRMRVTEWREGRVLGIEHVGLVTGRGRFTLRGSRGGTKFTWTERLSFPWWLGAWPGSVVGGRILRRIWRRNLANLKRIVES
jgi:hypothetical protein